MSALAPPLPMRAWTQRRTGDADAYGHQGAWVDVLTGTDGTGEPCSWWTGTGSEQIRPHRTVVLAGEHVRFDKGADVAAGDRIRRLVDQNGVPRWDTGDGEGLAREIEHVAVRRGHVEATLRSSS